MNNECSAFGATGGSTFYFEYKTKNKNIHGSEIIRTIALKLKSILLSSPQTTELKYQNNRCIIPCLRLITITFVSKPQQLKYTKLRYNRRLVRFFFLIYASGILYSFKY